MRWLCLDMNYGPEKNHLKSYSYLLFLAPSVKVGPFSTKINSQPTKKKIFVEGQNLIIFKEKRWLDSIFGQKTCFFGFFLGHVGPSHVGLLSSWTNRHVGPTTFPFCKKLVGPTCLLVQHALVGPTGWSNMTLPIRHTYDGIHMSVYMSCMRHTHVIRTYIWWNIYIPAYTYMMSYTHSTYYMYYIGKYRSDLVFT